MPSFSSRGFTSVSISARNSCGTPGSSTMMCPRASSHSPGAVPRGFFRTVAPSITMACRSLISGMARPNRRNLSWMERNTSSSRKSFRPSKSATVWRVRSSSVGPRPPDDTITSARSSACSNDERISSGRVADHGLVHHAQADLIQLRCQEKGIGVQPKRGEQFGTDCDDLSLHVLRVLLDEAEQAQATRVSAASGSGTAHLVS